MTTESNNKGAITLFRMNFSGSVLMVYSRFPDSNFPGWSFSRKDVSQMVFSRTRRLPLRRFPDRHFPGKLLPNGKSDDS